MAEKGQIEQTIKDFILSEFLEGESPDALGPDTRLLSGSILDSLSVLRLVSYLEEQFEIEFDADQVDSDHFDSVVEIAELVQSKLGAR